MNSENYENFTEILKYSNELTKKFWKRKIKQKSLFMTNQLMASAYL